MTFSDYYRAQFRQDLVDVLNGLLELHPHFPDEPIIQPRTVSSANRVILSWTRQRQALFASALFLTFVVDQVCYTYYRGCYDQFRRLTEYPKWRGDCPGGCSSNIHPLYVFSLVGKPVGTIASDAEPDFAALPGDLVETIRQETLNFFPNHLPGIDATELWERCDAEISTYFRLRYLASRSPAS